MRERINRLAKGFVDYGKATIRFSQDAIEETIAAGRKERGAFRIFNEEGASMKGLVYSTDCRVRVLDPQFHNAGDIRFEVDAESAEPGTEIAGAFQVVSSFGEFELPYRFAVTGSLQTTREIVTSLDAFAELAKQSDGLALKLFDSPDFGKLSFVRDNANCRMLYEGLNGRGSKRIAMEEFLTGTGVKEHILLSVDTKSRVYSNTEQPIQDEVQIYRSTWGYVRVDVGTDAAFVRLEKDHLTPDDFDGDVCTFRFTIDPKKLHSGHNYGRLVFRTIYQEFVISLEVCAKPTQDLAAQTYRQGYLNYTNFYLDYLAKQRNDWMLLNGMQSELTRMRSTGQTSDLVQMFHAEVYLLQGRKDQAGLLLEDAKPRITANRMEDVDTYCYYLYVRALYNESSAEMETLVKVLNKYSESTTAASNVIFFLLLRLDPMLHTNPSMKLAQMKQWHRKGCRSPFLYLAACQTWEQTPELLQKMDGFELQALFFGARRALVGETLANRIAALATQEREYRNLYYRLLTKLYEAHGSVELLGGICSLLMRGNKREPKYFTWYQKGVEADIRLTRLYEYYLYTLPEGFSEELPRILLLYFSYNNTLDYQTQARLYSYILEHCSTDEALAESYRKKIEEFALDQLFQGRISQDLARIYEETVYPEIVDAKVAKALPKLLYANCITCDNPHMKYAIVCYEELKGEVAVALRGGKAYVPIYSENARVLFQDGQGNRYEDAAAAILPLMHKPTLEHICKEMNCDHEMLELSVCREIRRKSEKSEEEVTRLQGLLRLADIHPEFRRELMSELIGWYVKHPEAVTGNTYLMGLDAALLEPRDRMQMVELLIEKDYAPEAYAMIEQYGYEGLDSNRLMKLCSRMILERLFGYDEPLLRLAFACFTMERADEIILEYLTKHYNGMSRDMYAILSKARTQHVRDYDLSERLLGQMLFSGCEGQLDGAFRAYAQQEACDEQIVNAYLVVKCYRYFLEGEEMGAELVDYMHKRALELPDVTYLPQICLMALTKYDSGQPALTQEECALCQKMLDELYRKNFVFAYYRDLGRFAQLPEELNDKMILEYQGGKAARLQIKTWILPAEEEAEAETMPHMYEGIYVKLVPLFYGETLEYAIYDANQGEEPVARDTIRFMQTEDAKPKSRVAMINRILRAAEWKDDDAVREAMIEYGTKDGLVEELFSPI